MYLLHMEENKMVKRSSKHSPKLGFMEVLSYIGPGFVVTVGFIDPGNWASNIAAGSTYGYALLWVVSFSTLSLIALQHNAAHLGIVTGLCLSEAATKFFSRPFSRFFLATAVMAAISTALAEILGAGIGLKMLTGIPVELGSLLSAFLVSYMLFSGSYKKIEKWIIGFVSLIGISFLIELSLVNIGWDKVLKSSILVRMPAGSLPLIMSILGAVVMPHNLFLHSEIIQSRQWHVKGEEIMQKQLKYEFTDTLFAMIVGFAINSSMIIMAAAVFYPKGIIVTDRSQAQDTLKPLLGNAAAVIFAMALLLAGISSSLTAAMAGGSIFAGIYQEPFDLADNHSRIGIAQP